MGSSHNQTMALALATTAATLAAGPKDTGRLIILTNKSKQQQQ